MHTRDKFAVGFIATILISLLCAAFHFWGYFEGIDNMRQQAVKHGAAEYSSDKDGKAQWQWKTPTK